MPILGHKKRIKYAADDMHQVRVLVPQPQGQPKDLLIERVFCCFWYRTITRENEMFLANFLPEFLLESRAGFWG